MQYINILSYCSNFRSWTFSSKMKSQFPLSVELFQECLWQGLAATFESRPSKFGLCGQGPSKQMLADQCMGLQINEPTWTILWKALGPQNLDFFLSSSAHHYHLFVVADPWFMISVYSLIFFQMEMHFCSHLKLHRPLRLSETSSRTVADS